MENVFISFENVEHIVYDIKLYTNGLYWNFKECGCIVYDTKEESFLSYFDEDIRRDYVVILDNEQINIFIKRSENLSPETKYDIMYNFLKDKCVHLPEYYTITSAYIKDVLEKMQTDCGNYLTFDGKRFFIQNDDSGMFFKYLILDKYEYRIMKAIKDEQKAIDLFSSIIKDKFWFINVID